MKAMAAVVDIHAIQQKTPGITADRVVPFDHGDREELLASKPQGSSQTGRTGAQDHDGGLHHCRFACFRRTNSP